jgi:hypothetical protein
MVTLYTGAEQVYCLYNSKFSIYLLFFAKVIVLLERRKICSRKVIERENGSGEIEITREE